MLQCAMFGGSVAGFVVGAVAGTIGFGVFLYGKKAQALRPTLVGIALMAYPYFISSTLWMVIVGMTLIGLLWWPA